MLEDSGGGIAVTRTDFPTFVSAYLKVSEVVKEESPSR